MTHPRPPSTRTVSDKHMSTPTSDFRLVCVRGQAVVSSGQGCTAPLWTHAATSDQDTALENTHYKNLTQNCTQTQYGQYKHTCVWFDRKHKRNENKTRKLPFMSNDAQKKSSSAKDLCHTTKILTTFFSKQVVQLILQFSSDGICLIQPFPSDKNKNT